MSKKFKENVSAYVKGKCFSEHLSSTNPQMRGNQETSEHLPGLANGDSANASAKEEDDDWDDYNSCDSDGESVPSLHDQEDVLEDPPPSSASAEELRKEGNVLFNKGDFSQAIEKYKKALNSLSFRDVYTYPNLKTDQVKCYRLVVLSHPACHNCRMS